MKKYYSNLSELIRKPTIQIALIAIISIFISALYFGENLKAEMGIIDDHTYLASGILQDCSLIWRNFINAPEIKSFGNNARFRIIYNLVNSIEVGVFGMSAFYFYLVNIFIFAFFIFCVFYITQKNLGIIWALPFTLFVIGQSYFAHIFTRLGTAEAWTILGLSLYSLGFSSLYQKTNLASKNFSDWKECLAMILGLVIMIGSKENFAVAGILIVALLIILKQRNKLTKTVVFSSILMLMINIYQVLHIFLTQKRNGVDFYQNDSGVIARITKLLEGAFSGEALFLSLSFLFFFVWLGVYLFIEFKKGKTKISDPILVKLFSRPAFIFLILIIFYLFNLYIYNGLLYTSNRYAFPSVLVGQILFLTFIRWVYDFWQYYYSLQYRIKFFQIFYIVILVGLVFFIGKSIMYSRQMSSLNIEATTLFQEKLKKIVKVAKKYPEYAIVFSSYQPFDYEPLISTSLYLRYYGIENKLMIKTNYDSAQLTEPLTKWVANENIKFEKEGGGAFVPLDKDLHKKCFNIDFAKETVIGSCQNLGKIWRFGDYPY